MLRVNQLSFSYNKETVLEQLTFDIQQGENLAVIGESGCGKTTLLKLIYGEYDLDRGHIHWKDTEILGPKFNLVIGYDFMKYVAQEFDLMPYITVEENVGKFLSNFFPEEKKERTQELLDVVELTSFAKTKVKNLSGGQKQRVALARALAKQPEILLLDEPFSHIDNFKKQSLRRRVFNYLKSKNITCIVATHDKNDVLGFADRMLLLNNKSIETLDRPEQLYKHPKTPLVASFFEEFNTIDNEIFYAHQISVVKESKLKAIVKASYFQGTHYLIEAQLKDHIILLHHCTELKKDSEIYLAIQN